LKYREAIKKCDKYFSLFIRLRDSDDTGYGRCITCGRVNHYKRMDCGHYIKRQHIQTRYDEQNCNVQCKYCNCFEQGANEKYKIAIDKKYGPGTSDKLEMKKLMKGSLSASDLLLMADYYRDKVNEIKGEKNE